MKQELIESLATHCDFYVGNEWYMESPEEKQRIWTEKFAELIVRECACIADDMKSLEAANAIKEHFGVD